MADRGPAPDWGIIGTAIAGVIAAIGGAIAVVRRGSSSEAAPPKGTDRTEQTLDGVFRLVEGLQEELALKRSELDRLERRVTALLEAATELRTTIVELRSTIADLERQIRAMGWPPPGNVPPELT